MGGEAVVAEEVVLGAEFARNAVDHDELVGLVGVGLPDAVGILFELHRVVVDFADGEKAGFGAIEVEVAIAIVVGESDHGWGAEGGVAGPGGSAFEGASPG